MAVVLRVLIALVRNVASTDSILTTALVAIVGVGELAGSNSLTAIIRLGVPLDLTFLIVTVLVTPLVFPFVG